MFKKAEGYIVRKEGDKEIVVAGLLALYDHGTIKPIKWGVWNYPPPSELVVEQLLAWAEKRI